MSIEEIRSFVRKEAERFGAKIDPLNNKSFIERNNTGDEAMRDNGAYFGLIHPDEDSVGPFHDFSLTVFPSNLKKPWLLCLGIGSNGFRTDYELATFPGIRRLFSKLIDTEGFCKTDFCDLESNLPKRISDHNDLQHLKNTIKKYSKFLPVCQIVRDPISEEGKKVISAFVAGYAKLRDWPTNGDHRNAISVALQPFLGRAGDDDLDNISSLLNERYFVVVQGPPGTGKTRIAKKIAEKMKAKTFFTQFHAEVSYSDFIYGIRPSVSGSDLNYTASIGIFCKAVDYAIKNKNEKTILIIDEINRANLANVLGPVFYLFEPKMDEGDLKIEICPGLEVTSLPKNFFVIATMNTADRSLAVVDFALRRRFAWYTLKPKLIDKEHVVSDLFYRDDFLKIQEIFEWYASSSELAIQPGQGYFIASSEEEMANRIRYEIYPLIREYLEEGLLSSAKEEFDSYFVNRIKKSLYT
jgi:hypothetical protein